MVDTQPLEQSNEHPPVAPIFFNGFLHSLIAEEAPDDFRYRVEVLDQSIRQPMELELTPMVVSSSTISRGDSI